MRNERQRITDRSVALATMSKEAMEYHRAAVGPETWSLGNGGVEKLRADERKETIRSNATIIATHVQDLSESELAGVPVLEITPQGYDEQHANYAGGFPPTMITTGTRELFLSDCSRLSTSMRQAGVDTRLHVWEGMWHSFEWYVDIPEAEQSLDEIANFLGSQFS